MLWILSILFASGALAQNACTSSECIKHAKEIIDGINQEVDPCDDFFEYACGTWAAKTKVPKGRDQISLLDMMDLETQKKIFELLSAEEPSDGTFRKTYDFYQSCINESPENDIAESLGNIINDIGGWPILGDDLQVTSFEELLQFQARMLKRGANSIFFNIGTDNRGNGPLQFNVPTEELIGNLNPDEVYSFVSLLNNELTTNQVHKDVVDMNKFIDTINQIIGNQEQDEEVLTSAAKVKMLPALSILFKSIRPVDDSDKIYINNDYLSGLQVLEDFRAIVNYQIFVYVKDILKQLHFTDSYAAIQSERVYRKPYNCLLLTKSCYDDALGLMFIKKYHDLDKDEEILKELFGNIMRVLKEKAGKAQWLDEESKAGAFRKIGKLNGYFELPMWAQKMKTLNEYYKNFKVDLTDIVQNSASCREQTFIRKLIATTKKHKKLPWDEPVFETNAMYYSDLNIFRLFEGYVQNPAFNPDWLNVMKYSSLGEVIGHEVSHGFDNDGVNYNENGDDIKWMTDQASANYQEIVQCYVNHYDKFIDTDFPSRYVNGTQTAPENIADNEGLKLAFYAYRKWVEDHGEETLPEEFNGYNTDAVFFLSYAHTNCAKRIRPRPTQSKDEHAPDKVRINGVTSNMLEFANAFNCAKGTFMNPDEAKCAIW